MFTYKNQRYVYNSLRNSLGMLDDNVYEMFISNNISELVKRSDFQMMLDNGFLHSKKLQETDFVAEVFENDRQYEDVLTLTIILTMNCNLRCIYCYQNNSDTCRIPSRRISKTVISNLLKFLGSYTKIKTLEVTWFGGEPLLELEILKHISNLLIDFCLSNNIKYNASIITNGYLLDEKTALTLLNYKVTDIQLTIDGVKSIHDYRHRHINPKNSSYNKIISFLKLDICDLFYVNLRINIDKKNIDYVDNLLLELKDLYKKNMIIDFARVESYNDNCNNKTDIFSEEEFSKITIKLKQKLIKYGLFSNPNQFFPKNIASYCGATRNLSLMIDYKGDIFKCWCDLENTKYSIGNLKNQDMHDSFYTSYELCI